MGARTIPATIDFGANPELGSHCFRIQANADQVRIVEDFGFLRPEAPEVLRAVFPASTFNAVKTFVQREFNARTQPKGRATFRAVGETLTDRLLGRELCVLVWLLEDAVGHAQMGARLKAWQGLRPEERWWLAQTVIERAANQAQGRRGLRLLLDGGQ